MSRRINRPRPPLASLFARPAEPRRDRWDLAREARGTAEDYLRGTYSVAPDPRDVVQDLLDALDGLAVYDPSVRADRKTDVRCPNCVTP